MEKLYTVSKTKPRADCGSDHELLITKSRLKLKKFNAFQVSLCLSGTIEIKFLTIT